MPTTPATFTRVALLALATVSAAAPAVRAQRQAPGSDTTVDVEYRVVWARDKTRAEVEDAAIAGAISEAIRRAVGIHITSLQTALREESGTELLADVFHTITQATTAGRMVASDKLEETWGADTSPVLGVQQYYRVKLRVTVARERGPIDPGFLVSVALNQDVYVDRYDGDDDAPNAADLDSSDVMLATVRATRDAYITLFTVRADTVEVVFPNSHWAMRDNFVKGGTALAFPPVEVRRMGIPWRASLPAGRARSAELLAAVATKTRVPFDVPPPAAAPPKVHGSNIELPKASLAEFNQWIVRIPSDQRTVNFASYEVRKGRKK